jgi:hypothetical protein
MAASPASTVEHQSGTANHRLDSAAKTMPTGPTSIGSSATDDEILGLATNIRRKDSAESQRRSPTDVDAQERTQGSTEKATSVTDRVGTQEAPKFSDDARLDDIAVTAAQPVTTSDPSLEPAHLQAAFQANPELREAWLDAKSYRKAFPTPEAARAATGMLADLNRMDALFFSQRPEDHAQLAHAVADLDPVAFASLARAMSQVAQSAGVTFPAIAARSVSASNRQIQDAGLKPGATKEPSRQDQHATASARDSKPANGVTPAQEQFFHATNAAAVEGVVEAIESQVERLLPDGISKSARNRVVGEIYHELD